MILTGNEIKERINNNDIFISNFNEKYLDTNSYDLCLGDELTFYEEEILDIYSENKIKTIKIPKEGFLLEQNSFVLGCSDSIIGSNKFVPIIHGKSTTARAGLFVHITADLIDIGFQGKVTFQLHNLLPIKLYPGMRIAQVSFWVPKGEITLYNGKYQGAESPLSSKSYMDLGGRK